MRRETKIRILNDTSLFDSMQLHVRSVLSASMRCWAQWAIDHMRSFPRLVNEFGFGLVVVGASIEHERPFTFFSADEFHVVGYAEAVKNRRLLLAHISFMNGDERFISLQLICRPVTMMDKNSFAAVPSQINSPILEMFDPDEISDARMDRKVPMVLESLPPDSLIAETTKSIRLHRHDCEAADQWSYIEIAANAASARENMVLDAESKVRSQLQKGLSKPTRYIDIEITRPLFLFDAAQIQTRAHNGPDGLTFVHVYQSQLGGAHNHATVIERFGV